MNASSRKVVCSASAKGADPCPFCPNATSLYVMQDAGSDVLSVACAECGGNGPRAKQTISQAVERWNARGREYPSPVSTERKGTKNMTAPSCCNCGRTEDDGAQLRETRIGDREVSVCERDNCNRVVADERRHVEEMARP